MELNPNPAYTGPGTWFTLHISSLYARTKTEKKSVGKIIELLSRTFPCMECRNHIQEYIKEHPLDTVIDNIITMDENKNDISLFEWTVDFHNAVNKRIRKKIFTLEEAYNLYSNIEKEGCKIGDCSEKNTKSKRTVRSI